MSTGLADAVAAAEPSVVNIYSSKAVHTRLHPICELPRYRELCDAANEPDRRPQNSLGSGVIVRSDGYILTNAHVIADADEILVSFSDEQKTSAQLIGTDPETDLAVIRANATGLRPIRVGSSDSARVGDIVLAIGNPFGIGQTVSMGIVSAKGRYGLRQQSVRRLPADRRGDQSRQLGWCADRRRRVVCSASTRCSTARPADRRDSASQCQWNSRCRCSTRSSPMVASFAAGSASTSTAVPPRR